MSKIEEKSNVIDDGEIRSALESVYFNQIFSAARDVASSKFFMKRNRDKGVFPLPLKDLLHLLKGEVLELSAVIESDNLDSSEILGEIGDVLNFAAAMAFRVSSPTQIFCTKCLLTGVSTSSVEVFLASLSNPETSFGRICPVCGNKLQKFPT